MKGSMSKKLRKALCVLFTGALMITSVPTANVVAYAEESIETETFTYDMSELDVHERWEATENKENGYKVSFADKYKQIFYVIPSEVDMTKLVKVSIEMSAADMAVKFCTTDNLDPGLATVYNTNEVTLDALKSALTGGSLADIRIVGLMSLEGAVEKTLGKITFTVEKEEEPPKNPGSGEPKPEEPKEPVYERPVVDAPVIDVPVAEEPTTEEPTVEEPTTEQPTVEEPTTEEPTTEGPTTEEPTVEEPTTEEPTVEEPTTEEPTVEEPTTEEPTVEEPTEPEPEKQPVVEKVTGKAITVTAGKTATIKMPCKKAKIKSVKYTKLSAKAAKVVKIDKKNNKVKGLKAGKATIKATITKKNGDKIVMTTKVTVKAAPKPVTKPTTPQAKNYSYTMDKLNSFAAWDVTASGSGSNYKVTFSRQYAQIFYEIPSEVDVANLKSVVVEFDDSSKVAIKLGQKFVEYSDAESVYGIVYETDTFAYGAENVTLANSKIAKKDIKWVNFMNLQDGSLTRTIKKITFKL